MTKLLGKSECLSYKAVCISMLTGMLITIPLVLVCGWYAESKKEVFADSSRLYSALQNRPLEPDFEPDLPSEVNSNSRAPYLLFGWDYDEWEPTEEDGKGYLAIPNHISRNERSHNSPTLPDNRLDTGEGGSDKLPQADLNSDIYNDFDAMDDLVPQEIIPDKESMEMPDIRPDIESEWVPDNAPDLESLEMPNVRLDIERVGVSTIRPDRMPDIRPDIESMGMPNVRPDIERVSVSVIRPDSMPDIRPNMEGMMMPDIRPDIENMGIPNIKPDLERVGVSDIRPDWMPDIRPDMEGMMMPDIRPDIENMGMPNIRPDIESVGASDMLQMVEITPSPLLKDSLRHEVEPLTDEERLQREERQKQMHEIVSKLEEKKNQKEKYEIGKVFYSNGDLYAGDLFAETPHGFGSMLYKDGSLYTGQWNLGEREGEGNLVDRSGDIISNYTGMWRNNKKTYKGRIVYSNGDTYEGGWNADMYYGYGELCWNNWVYIGGFLYGLMEGRGVIHYSDGSRFVGVWRSGNPVGVGRYYEVTGKCLVIDWTDEGPSIRHPCLPRNNLREQASQGRLDGPGVQSGQGHHGRQGQEIRQVWREKEKNGPGHQEEPIRQRSRGPWRLSEKLNDGPWMLSEQTNSGSRMLLERTGSTEKQKEWRPKQKWTPHQATGEGHQFRE